MSLIYVGIANITMMAITMWYTSGHLIAEQYLPFVTIRHFLAFGAFCWMVVIFIDFKYIAPARQKWMNRHAAKHKNPILELLQKVDKDNKTMKKDMVEIKKSLNRKGRRKDVPK